MDSIRVILRGKAHSEWKVVVSGERRTVKDDQIFVDERTTIWGKEKGEGNMSILPRGHHSFPFKFHLPESCLPCSFEAKPCTVRGVVSLKTLMERTAYCCGESIRLKADIDNQSEENVRLKLKLVQYVEFFIERGVLGLSKEVNHTVLEYRGDPILPSQKSRFESSNSFVVPIMPPTLVGICRLLQIYYVLKV
ncbi:unnamed protein product, partial [Medioppia subpectinata]